MLRRERLARLVKMARVQLKLESHGVMLHEFSKGQVSHFIEPRMALATAPMVLPASSQHGVAQRKPRFSQIASDEINLVPTQSGTPQMFPREQQAAAAIEQQPRGFRERDFGWLQMLSASAEQAFVSNDTTVPRDEVVGEH
jgi:hypothetical protein